MVGRCQAALVTVSDAALAGGSMTVGPGAMCQATSPLQGYRTLQTGSPVRPDGLNTIVMQDIPYGSIVLRIRKYIENINNEVKYYYNCFDISEPRPFESFRQVLVTRTLQAQAPMMVPKATAPALRGSRSAAELPRPWVRPLAAFKSL